MQCNLSGKNVLSNALNGVLGSLLVAGFNVTDGAGLEEDKRPKTKDKRYKKE